MIEVAYGVGAVYWDSVAEDRLGLLVFITPTEIGQEHWRSEFNTGGPNFGNSDSKDPGLLLDATSTKH
jgi:hypothetical protein